MRYQEEKNGTSRAVHILISAGLSSWQERKNEESFLEHILISVGVSKWDTFKRFYLHYLNLPEDLKELTIALDNPTSE